MRDECPLSEVRAPSQHPPSRTSESHGLLTNLLILVPLCRSEVPDRIRRLWSRDFRSAVLAFASRCLDHFRQCWNQRTIGMPDAKFATPHREIGRETASRFGCLQPTISLPEKNWAISTAAVSKASDPCTEFSPIDLACSLRMLPSAAFEGSVAPITSRYLRTALSPSRTWTTTGPEIMKSTNSPKNGRAL